MEEKFVIGVDFGTDSVRSVLIDSKNGKTHASHVHWYKRWKEGKYCKPEANQFRQHLLDHMEGMESTVKTVISEAGIDPAQVKGICIDTTGSSPVPVNEKGIALCMLPGFEENPNAMTVLWKDHTAVDEADEINQLCRTWGGEDFTRFEGGIYSSEWFWAKILHVIREDEKVKRAAHSWVEHCDLMTYLLVGDGHIDALKRSRCAAGHKAMWHKSWGGLPDDTFLAKLDPYLVELKKNLYTETFTSDETAGTLNAEWAERLGLSRDTVVSVGTFDAHAGALGAEATEYTLVRVMGTSTCDIIVSSKEAIGENTVRGICGQVDGSVVPGMIGLEAGQSAFGDVLAWFRDVISWPIDNLMSKSGKFSPEIIEELKDGIIAELSKQAAQTPLTDSVPVALDWVNGRRTPDANQLLKAGIVNLSLGTKAPHIFRALVEAISFGSKKIIDRFEEEGVEIRSVVAIGGVAKKSDFVMQTLSSVLNVPIKVATSDQAPALGAAMYAAVAAGIYPSVKEAIDAMGNGFEKTYQPNAKDAAIYQGLYEKYNALGEFVEGTINKN